MGSSLSQTAWVWIATLVPGIVIAMAPRQGIRIVAVLFALAIGTMLIVARAEPTILGYHLHLDFEMPWRALFDAYFAYGNWNLLWYGLIGIVILMRRELVAPSLAPFTAIIVSGLLFLVLLIGFGNTSEVLAPQTTANRATLHLAPLIAIYLVVAFQTFATRWMAAHFHGCASASAWL